MIKNKKDIEGINIPQELLDSILNNPKLNAVYNKNILDKQREKLDSDRLFNKDDSEYIYDLVYLDLYKALDAKRSKHNLVLFEGDSIIIPKTMDVVKITGLLNNLEGNSISAPYFKRRRANYYINSFAGGFSQENDKGQTIVVYPNGIAKKTLDLGLFVISPRIKEGCTIKVVKKKDKKSKKKERIDWNAAIESAMIKATAILTLWLLIEKTQQD